MLVGGEQTWTYAPFPGLASRPDVFPTANAVGYYLSPCGLGGR